MTRLTCAALLAFGAMACPPSSAASGDAGRAEGGSMAAADASDARAFSLDVPDAAASEELIPATLSEELTARAKHLLEAIAHDNADLAVDILFPRDAFVGSRDVPDAGKVWERKVSAPFKKTVHRLGLKPKGMDRAQFVSIELGHSVLQEMPRKHGWKRAMWSVRHSRLNYMIDGKAYHANINEMIAWHGAWYVTKI